MSAMAEVLLRPEGKTLEFKRDVSSPDTLIRSIVAFANGAGGTLVVGVQDRTRRVCGVNDPTKVEEQLANLIFDRVEPRLVPELQVIPWRKTYLIAVRVFPSSTRPHYVKAQGPEQGVYVRVGSTNRRADPAQIERSHPIEWSGCPAADLDSGRREGHISFGNRTPRDRLAEGGWELRA